MDDKLDSARCKSSTQFDNICRICLHKAESGTNLFCDDRNSRHILDKIYICYKIIISYDEYIPNIICNSCIIELNYAEKFRVNCVTFEERFKILKTKRIKRETELVADKCLYDDNTILEDHKLKEEDLYGNTKDHAEVITNKNNKFQCNACNKILQSKISLSKHITSMHQKRKVVSKMIGQESNKSYQCTKCLFTTLYSQTLVNHMRRHTGEKPYYCECGKSFTQAGSLATHLKTHSNIMSHICPICGKQFRHSFSLKKHLLVHKSAQFICEICQKSLKTLYSLTAHMNRHYNIRNYSCENCGNTFVTSTDLMNHRKQHSPEKKVECHLCDYKTRAKKNLTLHLKRHAGEKSFECDICCKALYTQSDLRRHLRVHTHEKPYPCPECALRFSQPGSLNHHVRNLHSIANYQWGRSKSVRIPTVKQEKVRVE